MLQSLLHDRNVFSVVLEFLDICAIGKLLTVLGEAAFEIKELRLGSLHSGYTECVPVISNTIDLTSEILSSLSHPLISFDAVTSVELLLFCCQSMISLLPSFSTMVKTSRGGIKVFCVKILFLNEPFMVKDIFDWVIEVLRSGFLSQVVDFGIELSSVGEDIMPSHAQVMQFIHQFCSNIEKLNNMPAICSSISELEYFLNPTVKWNCLIELDIGCLIERLAALREDNGNENSDGDSIERAAREVTAALTTTKFPKLERLYIHGTQSLVVAHAINAILHFAHDCSAFLGHQISQLSIDFDNHSSSDHFEEQPLWVDMVRKLSQSGSTQHTSCPPFQSLRLLRINHWLPCAKLPFLLLPSASAGGVDLTLHVCPGVEDPSTSSFLQDLWHPELLPVTTLMLARRRLQPRGLITRFLGPGCLNDGEDERGEGEGEGEEGVHVVDLADSKWFKDEYEVATWEDDAGDRSAAVIDSSVYRALCRAIHAHKLTHVVELGVTEDLIDHLDLTSRRAQSQAMRSFVPLEGGSVEAVQCFFKGCESLQRLHLFLHHPRHRSCDRKRLHGLVLALFVFAQGLKGACKIRAPDERDNNNRECMTSDSKTSDSKTSFCTDPKVWTDSQIAEAKATGKSEGEREKWKCEGEEGRGVPWGSREVRRGFRLCIDVPSKEMWSFLAHTLPMGRRQYATRESGVNVVTDGAKHSSEDLPVRRAAPSTDSATAFVPGNTRGGPGDAKGGPGDEGVFTRLTGDFKTADVLLGPFNAT